MSDAYQRSVLKAVRQHGSLREFLPTLSRLRDVLAAKYPYDVAAVAGADFMRDIARSRLHARINLLLLRGYDWPTSQAIHAKFTEDFPDFSPEVAMLSPREVLVEQFGSMTGQLLATTLVHPEAQPFLHALWFKDLSAGITLVERQCVRATATAAVLDRARHAGSDLFDKAPWDISASTPLSRMQAEAEFFHCTDGLRLQLICPVYTQETAPRYMPYEATQETPR